MSEASDLTPAAGRARSAVTAGLAKSRLLATGVRESIRTVSPPTAPLIDEWQVGLGHLVRRIPQVPDRLSRLVSPLDRLAEVSLGPDHLAFDGERVSWTDVTEVRLGPVTDVLSAAAVDKELARITSKLPPVPGRKWVSTQVAELVLGLVAAVTESALDRASGADPALVPLGVSARGRFGRRRDMTPGLFAVLLCAAVPGVTTAICSTATEHGATIEIPPPSGAALRADQIRTRTQALRGFVEAKLAQPPAELPPAQPDDE
ncbi:MAG TPA: hypothetical protein VGP36_03320 [Mycobacteriales bacterium]|jgi:hypothetical protein|nr:hypothetical protein [Mycobacteriales bacterium]